MNDEQLAAVYARALKLYAERKRAALVACIDAGLPLKALVGLCALELELLLARCYRPPEVEGL